jgi:hypothetical protein
MEAFLSNQWTIAIFAITGIIGLGVCWFGVLIALLTALGNKKWVWGISMLFLGPVTGIPYTIISKEADYPKSLMIKGAILILPGALFLLVHNVMA